MKLITLFALILMTVTFTGCGGKDGGGGSSSGRFSSALSTKNGYYNTQTQALEIGGVTYPPTQAYAQVMNMAIQQAQAQGIQPILINGVYKFKARITGSAYNYAQPGYTNTGYNQPYNQQYGQQTLNLTSVVFYR